MTTHKLRMPHMLGLVLAAALGCAGCRDDGPMLPDAPAPLQYESGLFTCNADVRGGTVRCTEDVPRGSGGASRAMLGSGQIKMLSANLRYDTTTLIMSFDAAVQNLMANPIGTPDGTTRTGFKVFFDKPLQVSVYAAGYDTGTVYVANADGRQSFSAANQPYFQYDTILTTNQTSRMKRWEFHLPRSVANVTFGVRVFTFMPGERSIPEVAPNGFLIPSDSVRKLYANLVYDHPRLGGRYPRSVLEIRFTPGATAEERQAAFNAAGASLIGGGAGAYLAVVPDDGTGAPLWAAIDKLSGLPQVASARPDLLASLVTTYQRPDDGPGWRKADWQLIPDSSAGSNWAAEAIGAPFAWGCETGNGSATVAVADISAGHAEMVTSIIAEPADNNVGMAGLMWGGLVRNDTSGLRGDLDAAFADSAHVINISLGVGYWDAANNRRLPNPALAADSAVARRVTESVADVLESLELAYGTRPIYVLGSGNYNMDAWFSGLPQLVSDPRFAGRVLVVGAVERTIPDTLPRRSRWTNLSDPVERGSNTGTLVSIAAPGASVTLVSNGSLTTGSGTSFAAPHVAGAAGLLKSFDPRLTSAEIVALLLEGSRRGGWSSTDGKPLLNIYEALKAAARRSDAPMCGQRFWVRNGEFIIQRDGATGATHSPFTLPFSGVNPNVLHGGKQINFRRPNMPTVTYRWNRDDLWHLSTPDPTRYSPRGSNGTYHSRDDMSHDGDSAAWWYPSDRQTSMVYELELVDSTFNSAGVLATLSGQRAVTPEQCVQEFVSVDTADDRRLRSAEDSVRTAYVEWVDRMLRFPCQRRVEGTHTINPSLRSAYSPRGTAVYAFIATEEGGATVGPAFECGDSGFWMTPRGIPIQARVKMLCRNWTTSHRSVGTTVYRISIPSGDTTPLAWSNTNAELRFPSLREDLREMTLESRTWSSTASASWVQGADPYQWSISSTAPPVDQQCRLQVRNPATGAILFSPPTDCQAEGGDAGFSAVRRR